MMIALRGLSTRVDTTVAIAFAVSWKPLMKSKASATQTTRITSRGTSGILHNHGFDDVCNILALVHGNLHAVIDFLPLHHHDRVRVGGIEEVAQRLSKVVVALVLDLVNTDEKRPHR